MSQSNVIFFFVFAAFFVYITIRGELPRYAGLLLASPQSAPASGAKTSSLDVEKLASVATTAAEFLA